MSVEGRYKNTCVPIIKRIHGFRLNVPHIYDQTKEMHSKYFCLQFFYNYFLEQLVKTKKSDH